MRKTAARLILVLLLVIFALGCEPRGDTLVIRNNGYISYRQRNEGDIQDPWGGFRVEWKQNGCELSYHDRSGTEKTKRLTTGEMFQIETSGIPVLVYDFYLCKEGDSLPNGWDEIKQRQDRIESVQAEYGSMYSYERSRDVEAEKQLFQAALDAIGVEDDVDRWYRFFLEATWSNGDCSMTFTDASAKKNLNETKLMLTDDDGNELVIYNAYWCEYNGEFYYGYIE